MRVHGSKVVDSDETVAMSMTTVAFGNAPMGALVSSQTASGRMGDGRFAGG